MSSSDRTFEIGIALAGGSSRGCYSAGVMDFLFQAFYEWEKALKSQDAASNKQLPPWRVHLNTMAGTSAGALTASVALSCLGSSYQPITNQQELSDEKPTSSGLFEFWVNNGDFDELLSTDDLNVETARDKGIKTVTIPSLVNSNYPEQVASNSFQADRYDLPVPTFAKDIRLYMTTTNLRGVPYHIEGWQSRNDVYRTYKMRRHEDFVGFDSADVPKKGLFKIDLNGDRKSAEWNRVITVCLASAAFPIGLPAMKIDVPTSHYDKKIESEEPSWPSNMPSQYSYYAIDGGAITNEPLELVRESMEMTEASKRTQADKKVISKDAEQTQGAMILLHPTPSTEGYKAEYEQEQPSIFEVITKTIPILVNEARFKPDELVEFADEKNVSKFMLAPIRPTRKDDEPALGTDLLGGFAGTLDRDIRYHDFMLGRYNCQQFLKREFVILKEQALKNPIFGKESEQFVQEVEKDGMKKEVVPIVPLLGSAKESVSVPKWPRYSEKELRKREDSMVDAVNTRSKAVLRALAYNYGLYGERFLFGINTIKNFAIDRVIDIVARRIRYYTKESIRKAFNYFG